MRYLIVDEDTIQHNIARRFMAERSVDNPAFISLVTLAETVWVLQKRFQYSQEAICGALIKLLASNEIVFEEYDQLSRLMSNNVLPKIDIADYLIAWSGLRVGCDVTMTFDKNAARNIPSMELLT
ncbi:MAG: PIN domain-containing protein [Rhizobiaceae bacterium]|nr:PIN domain-containing protein [Rhizobiaceae bacterium]